MTPFHVAVNREVFVAFLTTAKQHTYAAQGGADAAVTPLLPGSRQLEYRDGRLSYRDIYFGSDYTFLDFTQADLIALLDLADTLREAWQAKRLPQNLAGTSIALIWDAEGFRNRVAFELGIAAMGGITVQIPGKLDERESIEDVLLKSRTCGYNESGHCYVGHRAPNCGKGG